MKTYIGLDLGSKTLGVAISSSGIIASALDTFRFQENNYEEALKIVYKLIVENQVTTIVLGLPKHMNNDLGIRGQISVDFKQKIEEKHPLVEVVLWDERLSTKTAIKTMIKGSESRKNQKLKKDELAAVVILQNYLDYKGAK
ncbi:MAG: Holliday junction resolvase RuvX [Acholeplasmataceae bacterium]|jgi:putative Holliday junction resolvase|nr:Holliday junction resolvase RuvX [Acholeplasmataceae bacterium]